MSLITGSMQRPVTVAMCMVAVILFGWISFGQLTLNLLPDLSYPTLTIRTELEGAAPAEIEEQITRSIEERVGVVSGLQRVHSVSTMGQSDVVLQFRWGTDMDMAAIEVREKLDLAGLPLDVERPRILRLNPNLDPIMRLTLARTDPVLHEEESLQTLRRFGEEFLKRRLEPVPGIAAVTLSGGYEDEIQVLMDQDRLAQLGITVQFIAQSLRAANVNLSGGRLNDGGQEYLVRTMNEFRAVEDIAETILVQQPSGSIRIRDVAQVVRGHRERESISRVDGREAIELSLYKEGDANTVEVAEAVRAMLERLQGELPSNYRLTVIYDGSVHIARAIDEVRSAALHGALLAVLVLFLFLRQVRPTLIVAATIPISVMATFTLMNAYGISLNVMSLGGIALAVGMLMDNAIVVLENVDRHRRLGAGRWQAVTDGAGEVMGAVIASTLTTVAVFVPLAFVDGIAGQLFRDQALTITFALLTSAVLAFSLLPMLASIGLRRAGPRNPNPTDVPADDEDPVPLQLNVGRANRVLLLILVGVGVAVKWSAFAAGRVIKPMLDLFEAGFRSLAGAYDTLLRAALRFRWLTLCMGLAAFVATVPVVFMVPMELIPTLSQGEFRAALNFSPGTRLEHTDRVLQSLHDEASGDPGVARTWSIAGTGGRLDASAAIGGENIGELTVVLATGGAPGAEERAMARLRAWLADLPDLEYTLEPPQLFTFSTPLEVEIRGNDLEALERVANALEERMLGDPMFADVEGSLRPGYPEIQILFDQDRANALGLSVPEVASRVVQKVRGDVPTRFNWLDRKVDIRVRDDEPARNSVEAIGDLVINPESDAPIRLSSVAELRLGTGPADIQRLGQQRAAIVSAFPADGDLKAASARVQDHLGSIPHPVGVVSRVAGQSEEMAASFRSMQFALLLAIVLVYLVMASLFESLLHPFVILFSIPLAGIGAAWALFLTNTPVSVVVFIGAILLAGIVVNNAIILVERVNRLRADGMARLEALHQAGSQRLRPIVMTTLTTVLGLLPMAVSGGDAGGLRAPMAITVIGGLVVSTLLTLVFIPALYAVVDRRPDRSDPAAGEGNVDGLRAIPAPGGID